MDYEDFLSMIYLPLKSIEVLTDTIYTKCNEDWSMYTGKTARVEVDEMLAINFAIELCAKHLLNLRETVKYPAFCTISKP